MIPVFGGPLSRVERVALAAGLVLSAALMWPMRGGIPDGAYVWLHIARHLANGAGLVFNPGERIYATANPLWVTVLADGMALGLDGLTFARVLGALATLLTVPLFLQLLRRTVRTPALRALGTLAWASQPWMARWALSGLETPLAIALVLGGFVALAEGADWGERPIRTGALWGLAALTRPGAVLLLALWGTALLIDAKSRPGLRRLVFGMLPPVLIYGSWLVFARVYFGTFWPAVLSTAQPVNLTLAEWWSRLSGDFGKIASTEGAIVAAGVLAIALGRMPARRRDRPALRLLPLAWVVLLPALFAARGLQVGTRHMLLVIPVVHWIMWWAVDRTWSGERNESRAWVRATIVGAVIAATLIGMNLVAYRGEVTSDSFRRERAANRTLIRWGHWLGANAHGSLVASDTPGALAYFGQVRILDLGGRFTPELQRTLRAVPRAEIVERLAFESVGRAAFLVDSDRPSQALLATSPRRDAFELIDERDGHAFYRLNWNAGGRDTTAKP